MSDEKSPVVSMIEAHEEFIHHIESGSSRIRTLSLITVFAAGALLVSYASQLLLPYLTGTTIVTVDLTDPTLQATEVAVAALTALWLFVGASDYLFTKRMTLAIKESRALESELERKVSG